MFLALAHLAVLELVGYGTMAVLGPRLGAVGRTGDFYAEQTALFQDFLRDDASRREVYDPVLGWRYRAGFADERHHINAQGVRSSRSYTPAASPDVLRVAAYGDSFVYCNEVADGDAWPTLLEGAGAPIEVLNYGVGGYGTDQALLRYLTEGDRLAPDVVLIGYAPMDIRRVVNVYRRFLSPREGPWIKPRYVLEPDGSLRLVPNPVGDRSAFDRFIARPAAIRELGRQDYWYEPAVFENPLYDWSGGVRLLATLWVQVDRRYLNADRLLRNGVYNTDAEAFRIQVALLHRFAAEVRNRGAVPVFLLLPDKASVQAVRRGARTVYSPLSETLRRTDEPLWDAADAFSAVGREVDVEHWFMPGGHYSPVGNRLVAEWLRAKLRERFALPE